MKLDGKTAVFTGTGCGIGEPSRSKFTTQPMLAEMKPDAVIVDVAIDHLRRR